jgi:hypothetical protein
MAEFFGTFGTIGVMDIIINGFFASLGKILIHNLDEL